MKYAIVFFPKNDSTFIYIRNDAKIDDGLYEKFVDSKIPVTDKLNEALLFDDFELAKSYIYKLKYHYRKLFKINVGVKIINDNLLEGDNKEWIAKQ